MENQRRCTIPCNLFDCLEPAIAVLLFKVKDSTGPSLFLSPSVLVIPKYYHPSIGSMAESLATGGMPQYGHPPGHLALPVVSD
jgi:hypothetical protein